MLPAPIIKSVQKYLRALTERGLEPSFAVVFGSQASGRTGPWSDIDLIVVAKKFDTKYRHQDVSLLWRVAARTDSSIEPLPCGERQWEEDDGTPIIEIARREGVIVRLD